MEPDDSDANAKIVPLEKKSKSRQSATKRFSIEALLFLKLPELNAKKLRRLKILLKNFFNKLSLKIRAANPTQAIKLVIKEKIIIQTKVFINKSKNKKT
jgi:CO dehydrogenase/acetyl-CoA synthase beta subunit